MRRNRPLVVAVSIIVGMSLAAFVVLLGVPDESSTDGDNITTQVVVVNGERFACFTQESSGEDEFDCEPLRTGAN